MLESSSVVDCRLAPFYGAPSTAGRLDMSQPNVARFSSASAGPVDIAYTSITDMKLVGETSICVRYGNNEECVLSSLRNVRGCLTLLQKCCKAAAADAGAEAGLPPAPLSLTSDPASSASYSLGLPSPAFDPSAAITPLLDSLKDAIARISDDAGAAAAWPDLVDAALDVLSYRLRPPHRYVVLFALNCLPSTN